MFFKKLGDAKLSFVSLAIIVNLAYASYATLAYSFLGDDGPLRNVLIVTLAMVNMVALACSVRGINVAIALFCVFGALMGGTYLLYPGNRWVIQSIGIDVARYLLLTFFLACHPFEKVEKSLLAAAWIILLCGLMEPFTKYVTAQDDGYMVYGMRVLNAALIFIYCYFKTKGITHLLAGIVSMMMIFLHGNRSALLISFVGIALMMILFADKKHMRSKYFKLAIGGISAAVLVFSGMLEDLGKILEGAGMSSRTLLFMQSGIETLTNDNGRSTIWENCRAAIADRVYTGYGIGGERNLFLLGVRYQSRMGGVYAHNFIYELLLDFGVILGGGCIVFLLYHAVKIIRDNHSPMRNLFALLTIATGIKLSFSSSLWSDINFYICLGLAMNHALNAGAHGRNRALQAQGSEVRA